MRKQAEKMGRDMPEDSLEAIRSERKVALIVHSTKLADFEPGLDRAAYIASLLVDAGYKVDLITSSFQHWSKSQRDQSDRAYTHTPYNIVFIDEPGYKKNICLSRIISHHSFNRRLARYLSEQSGYYDVVWCQMPPNNVARTAASFAEREGIPLLIDLNDLWPDAMRMVMDIPIISDVAFAPMERDAAFAFNAAWGIIGTSQEYALHPKAYINDGEKPCIFVYVGNDLARFDAGASEYPVEKPDDEIWVTYAGTLGKSYDVENLIDAIRIASEELESSDFAPESADGNNGDQREIRQALYAKKKLRLKVLGDGPNRETLEARAKELPDDLVEFLGYLDYGEMAGYLSASDIVVNSLAEGAPQSIVSKIADYLASGSAIISTGTSSEMASILEDGDAGITIHPGDSAELADAICSLVRNEKKLDGMSKRARTIAEGSFDRASTYREIVNFVDEAAGL